MEAKDIYVSMDEAREEIKKRWDNVELKKAVEEELGDLFWPELKNEPRSVLWRFLLSPDNGFTFFWQRAHYINAKPLVLEYLGDTFISLNEEKKGLGRLRVIKDGKKATVDIVDFANCEKLKIEDLFTKNKKKLTDFHHELVEFSGFRPDFKNITSWCHNLGKPKDYYYPFLLQFLSFGVLFEYYVSNPGEDQREWQFTESVVLPVIEEIKSKFGYKPLMVKLYPTNQSEEEDFYWWSYPPHINSYILEYAEKENLEVKFLKNNSVEY